MGMAGRNRFDFKRFSVRQEGCAMKVGTDGVLLGAWCRIDPSRDKALLDIGAGTGVIALQLAQRTEKWNAAVDAVEIDGSSCLRAEDNFKCSPWSDRLRVYHYAIQDFTECRVGGDKDVWGAGLELDACIGSGGGSDSGLSSGLDLDLGGNRKAERRFRAKSAARYDHIVSNPPYFVDSLSSPDDSRTIARHSYSLSYGDLLKCCFKLLNPGGRVSLIVPAGAETEKMITAAGANGFAVSRRTVVHSTPRSGPKRTLLEFMRRCDKVGEVGCRDEIGVGGRRTEVVRSDGFDGADSRAEGGRSDENGENGAKNAMFSTFIIIEGSEKGSFSAEYRDLMRDFYLYF